MKVNIFVPTRSGGKFADHSILHSSITGEHVCGLVDPENGIITEIDESRMSPEKIMVTQFLVFLGNRRLTMESLKKLPISEQLRLKQEFFEG